MKALTPLVFVILSLFASCSDGGRYFGGKDYWSSFEVGFDMSFEVVPATASTVDLHGEIFGNEVYPRHGGIPNDLITVDVWVNGEPFYRDSFPSTTFTVYDLPAGHDASILVIHDGSRFERFRLFTTVPGGEASDPDPEAYIHLGALRFTTEAELDGDRMLVDDDLSIEFPIWLLAPGATFEEFRLQITEPPHYPGAAPRTFSRFTNVVVGDRAGIGLGLDYEGNYQLQATVVFWLNGNLEAVHLPWQWVFAHHPSVGRW